MNKLEIKLKQHTPLIHFQWEQEGATLRASEVKPKLDKFIIEHAFHNNFEECYPYLIGYYEARNTDEQTKNKEKLRKKFNNDKFRGLNYKMRIETENIKSIRLREIIAIKQGREQHDVLGRPLYKTENYPDNNNSLIMSNIGGRERSELLNFSLAENVKITLLLPGGLKDIIVEYIFRFCVDNNFGNRKSKGFGSFIVDKINGAECSEDLVGDYFVQFDIKNNKPIDENKAYKDIFIVINTLWKMLKRNTNRGADNLKNVLLGVPVQLPGNPERIPSPIQFKPIIITKEKNRWEIILLIQLNKEVIKSLGSNVSTNNYDQKINDLLINPLDSKSANSIFRNKTQYDITNFSIE